MDFSIVLDLPFWSTLINLKFVHSLIIHSSLILYSLNIHWTFIDYLFIVLLSKAYLNDFLIGFELFDRLFIYQKHVHSFIHRWFIVRFYVFFSHFSFEMILLSKAHYVGWLRFVSSIQSSVILQSTFVTLSDHNSKFISNIFVAFYWEIFHPF